MKVRASWAIIVWLVAWQLGSMALGSDLLLPGPLTVLIRTGELLPQPAFWARVGFSLARVLAGFALGAALGMAGAAAAARWHAAEELLAPPMALAKSVPVASITVLALIWLRAANLAVLVVLLVVLPVVYENALQGLRATDARLSEAAQLLHLRPLRRLRFITMPTLFPYLQTSLTLGLSTAWKAGVAAEVIGIPAGSLGEAIYDAKVYFDTPALFAVTLAVVLASALCTAALRALLNRVEPVLCGTAGHAGRLERVEHATDKAASGSKGAARMGAPRLHISNLAKSFGATRVLDRVTLTVAAGSPVCLMAPSGAGKTTLLRIIAQLEHADAGSVAYDAGEGAQAEPDAQAQAGVGAQAEPDTRAQAGVGAQAQAELPTVSLSFQDDRLANQASVLANVRMALAPASPAWDEAPALLEALGLKERLYAAAGTCSGGERRRVGIARALLAPHRILLLDEPFNGLDAATKERVAPLIRAREAQRIVIMASHDQHDAELLGAHVVNLV